MTRMRTIAYCRVSSDEQVRGFSLDDQEETLRLWCQQNGHQLLEVVRDEGHSGAYLERPGLDRVRDRVEEGGVALIIAQDANRITRDPGHRMLLDEEFDKRGCRLEALDDWGDGSHEGQLLKFLRGWVSKGERLKIAERTRRGRRQKSKQGLLVAPSTVPYGFRVNETRDAYLVEDEQMAVVRRIFQMVADGAGLYHVKHTLEAEAVPAPGGGEIWYRSTLRDYVTKDAYFPYKFAEVERLVAPVVAARLDPGKRYGIAWASRHDWKVLGRERRSDGTYRDVREHTKKPREEGIAIPVPESGLPREVAERARRNVALRLTVPRVGGRVWELAGGFVTCAGCGRTMLGRTVAPKNRKTYHYYLCTHKFEHGKRSECSNRNHRAEALEERVRGFARRLINDPDALRQQVEQQVRAERESRPWLRNARESATARERLAKLDLVADNFRDQQAEGLITMGKLREKLDALAKEREDLEARLALLADGEARLRELEELPELVEEYLRDLPELLGADSERWLREYETIPEARTEDNPLGLYTLTPERIRHLTEEELAAKRLAAEPDRGARFRELYAKLGLGVAVHADGILEITAGATNAKEIMQCNESSC